MKKIIFLSLFISQLSFSQSNGTTEQNSSRIKVYTPSSSVKANSESYKWTIKTDIFSALSGEFPVIAEYRFAKKISAEASAGLTYGIYPNFGYLTNQEYEGEGSTYEGKAAMGSSFRGGIKFYPSSDYDAIEGWSFGVQLFSRTNNREYTNDDFSPEFDMVGKKDSRNKTGVALTIAKQVFWDSNISFEYLLGIGFASIKHDFYKSVSLYDSATDTYTYAVVPETIKETVPNFQLGCRIGFGN